MKDLKHVVVGMDFSDPSRNAIREAARIAKWDHAALIAAYIFDSDVLEELDRHAFDIEQDVLAEAEGKMMAELEELLGPEHGVEPHFAIGHPVQGVMRALKEHSAELLVLGSHGITSDDIHRVGILASKCVRKAPVNVLLVRERQVEPFRKVVACVDFSPTSAKAAAHALHIAQQDGAELEFLHVNPTVDSLIAETSFFTAVEPPTVEDYEDKNIERLEECLEEFIEPMLEQVGGVKITNTVLTDTDVHRRIVDYLKNSDADLVVLGTRGKTSLQNLLLGTTAEKIIRGAPCSALAIKPEGFDYELA